MWRSIWRNPRLRLAAAGLILVLAPPHPAAGADEAVILAVAINGLDSGEVVTALRLEDGGLAVPERDLHAWHLTPPPPWSRIGGEPYVRLADLPGVTYQVDTCSQTLSLQAPPAAFAATRLTVGDALGRPAPSGLGGFFNYDLNWQRQDGSASAGGLFEVGLFNAWGSGILTGLWDGAGNGPAWRRLDTTWTIDLPERMQSLRLGDAIGRSGSWGRSVRFGGVQWATNFATQPGFVTFPSPVLRGETALPSTLDVYLDNTRLLRTEVPAGPFDLANLPVITGDGELRLVVSDLLGRQQVISQPYYSSQRLLKPGLRDFSLEIGAVREDYGLASNRYGRALLVATERLGVGPAFTRELRGELLAEQQTVGAGGTWLLPRWGDFYPGTLGLGAAASHGPDGAGWLLALTGEHHGHDFSLGLQAQYGSRAFVQLGQPAEEAPRLTLSALFGLPLGGNSLGLGYVEQTTWAGEERRLLTASYSLRLGNRGQLGLFALRDLASGSGTNFNLVWTQALGQDTSLSADLSRRDGKLGKSLQLQHNPPAGRGLGYRLWGNDEERYQAGATWQADHATYTVDAARAADSNALRLGVSGGIAVAGGGMFPSRRIDGSFAVVKVGDFENVRVYRDNQEVARTDKRGLAMITQLRAYQQNPVAVEQADLPIDAEVDTLELRLTPALRSGVVAEFPVRRGRQASLRLVDEAGQALPAGMQVRLEGDAREFPVGYDGQVFLTGLAPRATLEAEWAGRRCRAELILDEGAGPMPDLGTLICKGAPP